MGKKIFVMKEVSIRKHLLFNGVEINGLGALKGAVEKAYYMDDGFSTVDTMNPSEPIEGVHVACIWHLYPRFDDDDNYDYRSYKNFLISDREIPDEEIMAFAEGPHPDDFCLVNEWMDERFLPAVYCRGDGDEMTVAYRPGTGFSLGKMSINSFLKCLRILDNGRK